MKKIITIVGARPQFIKHFSFEKAAKNHFELVTIHTGQHYDENMSNIFFKELGMNLPNYTLALGGGNHGMQTGSMMIEIEKIIEKEKPDAVLVYGDTNSTLGGALVAAKLNIPVIHVEAGLRSYNKEMPEEINRVITDHISELLFVPSVVAKENLIKEGIHKNVLIVGDIMKDLVLNSINNKWLIKPVNVQFPYYFATIHRPYNTDGKERLMFILDQFDNLDKKVIFSIHPRTRNFMNLYNLDEKKYANIIFIDPQSYFNNLGYLFYSDGLITDSGGMQKEAYWLNKNCVTVRKETEWIETLDGGYNTLLFSELSNMKDLLKVNHSNWDINLYGDGNSSNIIVYELLKHL